MTSEVFYAQLINIRPKRIRWGYYLHPSWKSSLLHSAQCNNVSRFRLFLDGDLPSGYGVERNVTLYLTDTKVRCVCVCPGVWDDSIQVCRLQCSLSTISIVDSANTGTVQYSTPLCPRCVVVLLDLGGSLCIPMAPLSVSLRCVMHTRLFYVVSWEFSLP